MAFSTGYRLGEKSTHKHVYTHRRTLTHTSTIPNPPPPSLPHYKRSIHLRAHWWLWRLLSYPAFTWALNTFKKKKSAPHAEGRGFNPRSEYLLFVVVWGGDMKIKYKRRPSLGISCGFGFCFTCVETSNRNIHTWSCRGCSPASTWHKNKLKQSSESIKKNEKKSACWACTIFF